jgi:hypothetical protein
LLTVLVSLAWAVPPDGTPGWWEVASGEYRTECVTWDEQPWCRAFGTTSAPLEKIAAFIEDRVSYPKHYSHVPLVEMLDKDKNIFRMTIDLPAILGDRDEVLEATRADDGPTRVYAWRSVTHPKAPEMSGYTRLHRASGEWRLTPRADGGTDLVYTWQAEMQGHLPQWALRRIWSATGPEIVGETIKAVRP